MHSMGLIGVIIETSSASDENSTDKNEKPQPDGAGAKSADEAAIQSEGLAGVK